MTKTIAILLLIILSSCNRETKSTFKKEPARINTDSKKISNPVEKNEGVVYFSYDNGLNWENKDDGLSENFSIGLGGIAVSTGSLGIATKENGVYIFDFQKDNWQNIPTDSQIIQSNPGALTFYKKSIYIGTQFAGIFTSNNRGKTWTKENSGLGNLTIRKFAEIDNVLYTATNDGFYSYSETLHKWVLEYGRHSLQVNGITEFKGSIYIGTNQGIFRTNKSNKNWVQILSGNPVHNISSDDKALYAMTYGELLLSSGDGLNWQNIQSGLPENLYTFNVIKNNNTLFAGQWDGIYRKENSEDIWRRTGNGLPEKIAVTNLKSYNGILIITCSERKNK